MSACIQLISEAHHVYYLGKKRGGYVVLLCIPSREGVRRDDISEGNVELFWDHQPTNLQIVGTRELEHIPSWFTIHVMAAISFTFCFSFRKVSMLRLITVMGGGGRSLSGSATTALGDSTIHSTLAHVICKQHSLWSGSRPEPTNKTRGH